MPVEKQQPPPKPTVTANAKTHDGDKGPSLGKAILGAVGAVASQGNAIGASTKQLFENTVQKVQALGDDQSSLGKRLAVCQTRRSILEAMRLTVVGSERRFTSEDSLSTTEPRKFRLRYHRGPWLVGAS